MSSRAQRVLAIALAVFAFVALAPFALPDKAPPYGDLPIASSAGGTVSLADPGARIKPGDRIEWANVPLAILFGSARSAFALYRAHADGRNIDRDETRGLIDRAAAAAAVRAA